MLISKWHRRSSFRACLALAAALGLAGAAAAQDRAGTLRGRITDPNDNPLPGAVVRLEPRGLEAKTGTDGRFVLTGAPAGHATAEISCIGFLGEKREIDLEAGRDTRLEVQLALDLHVSETVTVTTSRSRGEVEALNQEKSAPNIVDVLPAEIVTSLPNANVADAVGRLPSVSLERDEGEGKYIQIRGTDPRLSNFEINSVHIPSPESSVRNVKLDIIPADLIGSIELHKTLTADQDGDAVGGSVNLITKTPGDHAFWTTGLQAGASQILNTREFYQGSASYSGRFGEDNKLGLFLGGDGDWNGRGINDIEPSVGTTQIGSSTVPVFGAMDLREYRYDRSRLGWSGGLEDRLGEGSTLYARGLLADFRNYGDRWVISPSAGSFITPTLTDNTGSVSENVQNRRPHEQIYSGTAGGDHLVGSDMLLDYHLDYSHSQQNRLNELQANFDGPSDVAFNVDGSNPYFPRFTPINGVNINDPLLYSLASWQVANERTAAHDFAGSANLSLSHRLGDQDGELKFGLKVRDEHKRNQNDDRFFAATGAPGLTLSQVLDPIRDPNYYKGQYSLGPVPSLSGVMSFLAANPAAIADDPNQDHQRDDPNNFTASERVSSAYAMETLQLPHTSLNFGVRAEHTAADYTGFQVLTDANGNYASTTPLSGSHGYTDLLPSVNARFEVDPATSLRLAVGRGIARPNYSDLPPFLVIDDQGKTVDTGNPNLKATHSTNYDLMLERFFSTVGMVSVGGFYKDLSDPIFSATTPITSGVFAGFRQSQPINGVSASIKGFEATWQQHFTFLPSFLSGFGIISNYTHTSSQATVPGRDDNPPLERTTPNLFNVSLTYDRGAFSARVAATYNDAYIFFYNFQPDAPGGLRGPNGDIYLYPHNQVDAQASYRLSNGVQVIVNFLNLNNEVFGFYQGSPRYTIQREFYGRSYSLGFRLTR